MERRKMTVADADAVEPERGRQHPNGGAATAEERVFLGSEVLADSSNAFNTILAVVVYLGAIHFNVALILFVAFFLPFSKALLVFGLLFMFAVLPVDESSKFGRTVSRYICKHVCSYFPITLHVEDIKAFHPNRAYVFGLEPHSVFPIGMLSLLNYTGFLPLPKIKILASSAVFYVPFLRHLWTWLSHTPVTKKNFISQLEAGYSCIVIPGGVREAFFMKRGSETGVWRWWRPPWNLILNLARAMKIMPIWFWGILGSPLPFKQPIHVVVGRPIEVQKNPEPAIEEVAKIHSQYVEALEELFDQHKARAGYPNLELKIF